jgi:Asp-tRNA(Asn)/Glu-tRNA(Gln) amidotransferase A subunit family amidase
MRMTKPLNQLSATELASLIARGETGAEAIVRACVERIAEREAEVGAWINFDAQQAIAAARTLDRGATRGPLHGIPFGVKDIIDTVDYPTECGTPVYAGRRTPWDAACVAAARAAGGLLLGKTVSTELAYFAPGKTRNPHMLAHTPGGSSSGSAAAVADYMIPLAIGTQTGGSVIRPAAFCGIVGYKPSFGLVSRAGVKTEADSLDTVGFFARTVADAALFASAITGRRELAKLSEFGSPIRIAICRTPEWPAAAAETVALFQRMPSLLASKGAVVSELDLPEAFREIRSTHAVIMAYEAAHAYAYEWHAHGDQLSRQLRELIGEGIATSPERYDAARIHGHRCRALFAETMRDFDVVLTPSAVGQAPEGLASTGSPAFNRMWTLLGTPAVTVPAGLGPLGLPLGAQVVGAVGDDSRTLSAAAWIHRALQSDA